MAAKILSPHPQPHFSIFLPTKLGSRAFIHHQTQPCSAWLPASTTPRKQLLLQASLHDSLSSTSALVDYIGHQHHLNPTSFILLTESVGYSLASYYTSLGLFVISVPGLWSLIKRSVKSKVVQKTFIGGEEKKAPNQVAGEILSFFTRNNFAVTDRGETITGAYYWTRASRKEQIKVKMIVAEEGTLSEIIVQGDDEQVDQMRKELQLSEKGMVYVKGIFER